MASHKRRGHLDKPTRDHLTGIEAAFEMMRPKPRHKDEFTAKELLDKLKPYEKSLNLAALRGRLLSMVQAGKCERRVMNIEGKVTNLYRMTSPDSAP